MVEIWADVVCPWCYIGKRRFETALACFCERDAVEVVWRSFELDPGAPAERPENTTEHLVAKFGTSREQAEAMQERVAALAAAEGLELRFDRARGGNTFDAHRLLHLAADHGRGAELAERFFRGFFTDGEAIGSRAVLERLAVGAGMPASAVAAVLSSDRYTEEVRADERRARELGATGVPFFVFDGRLAIAGAQATDVFATALEEAQSQVTS